MPAQLPGEPLDLDLPLGPGLPPPPPMDRDAFWEYMTRRQLEFYQSPHYEAWLKRTPELKREHPSSRSIDRRPAARPRRQTRLRRVL